MLFVYSHQYIYIYIYAFKLCWYYCCVVIAFTFSVVLNFMERFKYDSVFLFFFYKYCVHVLFYCLYMNILMSDLKAH